jgi:CRP-like cAMP-binding protein
MQLSPLSFVAESGLLDALAEHSAAVDTTSVRVLFRQGARAAGIYIVRKGVVIISMASPEKSDILWVRAEPNSLLGLPALLSDAPLTLTATAMAGSQVRYVDRESYWNLMLAKPHLAVMVLRVLASEVHTARLALAGCSELQPLLRPLKTEAPEHAFHHK